MTTDPLDHVSEWRLGTDQLIRDLGYVFLVLSGWLAGLVGLNVLGKNPTKDNVEIATFLAGFLTLAGAATKGIYEWRLKARSENRQKWIDEIRATLSLLIENIPGASEDGYERREKAKAYLKAHGKLELLLNPSERDHRALMALIRHIYGHDNVPIDDIPRKHLGIAARQMSNLADRIALSRR